MVSLQFRGSKFLIKPALLAIDKALSAFKEMTFSNFPMQTNGNFGAL